MAELAYVNSSLNIRKPWESTAYVGAGSTPASDRVEGTRCASRDRWRSSKLGVGETSHCVLSTEMLVIQPPIQLVRVEYDCNYLGRLQS